MSVAEHFSAVVTNARAQAASGNPRGAVVMLEEALDAAVPTLGGDHLEVLAGTRLLASLQRGLGEVSDSRRLLEEAIAAGHHSLGEDHPVLLGLAYDLATLADELGNRHEARRNFGRLARFGPAVLGPDHSYVQAAEAYLGGPAQGGPTQGGPAHAGPARPTAAPPIWQGPPSVEPAPRDAPAVDLPARATPPRDLPSRDLPPQDVPPRDVPVRDVPVRDIGERIPIPAPEPGPAPGPGPGPEFRLEVAAPFLAPEPAPGYRPTSSPAPEPVATHRRGEPPDPLPSEAPLWGEPPWPEEQPRHRSRAERDDHRHTRAPLIVLGLVAVLALAGGVVAAVAALSAGKRPTPALTTIATASTSTLQPPGDLRLREDGGSITLTWTDPTDGTVPFVVHGGQADQAAMTLNRPLAPGTTSYVLNGLNDTIDYCFVVLAIYSTGEALPSGQVCTKRTNTVRPGSTGSASPRPTAS